MRTLDIISNHDYIYIVNWNLAFFLSSSSSNSLWTYTLRPILTTYLQHGLEINSLAFVFPIPTYSQNSSIVINFFHSPFVSLFLIICHMILQAAVRKQHHWNLTIFSDRISLYPEVSLSETASSPQSPYPFACNQIVIAHTFTFMPK